MFINKKYNVHFYVLFMVTEQESNCFKIVKMILERKFAPVIVFSFSKKDCEAYAMQMTKLDFNTGNSYIFLVHKNLYVMFVINTF